MVFYSIGSYLYALPLVYFTYLFFMAPIYSLFKIFEEAKRVKMGQKHLRFDFQFIDGARLDYSNNLAKVIYK